MQRMVGAGLDFGRRWAVRSGRRWAGLQSALGNEEWSARGRRWAGLRSVLGNEEWSALGSEEWSALGWASIGAGQ